MSLFGRDVSRPLNNGLEDEKEIDMFDSVACWRSKPNGRGHIDVMARERGIDTTSPDKKKTHLRFILGEKEPQSGYIKQRVLA